VSDTPIKKIAGRSKVTMVEVKWLHETGLRHVFIMCRLHRDDVVSGHMPDHCGWCGQGYHNWLHRRRDRDADMSDGHPGSPLADRVSRLVEE
jgi:hypothetical protein